MASAAANSALATEVLAVQRLYYNITPNAVASIFLLFSSQLLGYGIGGILRCKFAFSLVKCELTKYYNEKQLYCIPQRCFIPVYFRSCLCSMRSSMIVQMCAVDSRCSTSFLGRTSHSFAFGWTLTRNH